MNKKEKVKTIKIGNWEYEIETHDFGKKLGEIKIPKGWELWKPSDCWRFYEDKKLRKKMNVEDCWFFVFNPFKDGRVARFGADFGGAYLYCYRYPDDSGSSLGVRFKRKLK